MIDRRRGPRAPNPLTPAVAGCLTALFCLAAVPVPVDADSGDRIEELVVVATRAPSPVFDLPYSIHVVNQAEVLRASPRTLPQAFRDVPGIMVQETSAGQGSPYIRGFTGFRNLFLIDGVRLNNAVFRDGPNQYWATVDLAALSRIEVINGPASTLYGSDAVGGTVNAVTADAFATGNQARYRYASAERSSVLRVATGLALGPATAVRVGATGKSFGDLRGGGGVGRQDGVGYDEFDVDLKLASRLGAGWLLEAFTQHVRQNNVPRTHRTTDAVSWRGTTVGSDQRRELDQERSLSYLRLGNGDLDGAISRASVTVSYAGMEETRDRIRGSGSREKQGFEVRTPGLSLALESPTAIGDLSYGVEYYDNRVDSFSTRNPVQGPVGDDATYSTVDAFLRDRFSVGDRAAFVAGIRHTRAHLDANSVSEPVTGERIAIDDRWHATVVSLNASYVLLDDRLMLFGGVSESFRAPNLSDVTRFDSARSNEFEIPAPGLDPETFLTAELGLRWRGESSSVTAAVFRTEITDLIQRFPTGRIVDGEVEITKDNVGDGAVHGVELTGSYALDEQLTLSASASWMDGEVSNYVTTGGPPFTMVDEPPDRLMPLTGSVSLRWQSRDTKRWIEGRLAYADAADDLSTRDAADTSRIPPGGTPGYAVVHVGGGVRFTDRLGVHLTVDNVLDKDYRVHGSGTNMPGINAMLTLDVEF